MFPLKNTPSPSLDPSHRAGGGLEARRAEVLGGVLVRALAPVVTSAAAAEHRRRRGPRKLSESFGAPQVPSTASYLAWYKYCSTAVRLNVQVQQPRSAPEQAADFLLF